MGSIMDKLKSNTRLKNTEVLTKSKIFKDKDVVTTNVPMINVALSGSLTGGLTGGLITLAGPSKHFKSLFALLMAAAYLEKHKDAVLIFYDSEFGSPQSYFRAFGIDTDRVLHTPVMNIEELKFDMMNQLDNITRKDKIVIIIDSVGNLASKKEVDDALKESDKADMTRAKMLKGVFRMITPYLKINDIPLIAVNHTYQSQEMFSRTIVSGGTGIYYSSDQVWIIGRQQDKVGTEVRGYHFIVNIEKSRFVKEKSKIPISISWDRGIEKYSGLLDVAVEGSFVHKGKKGKSSGYSHMNEKTGVVKDKVFYERETNCAEFWDRLLDYEPFHEYITNKYQIGLTTEIENIKQELNDV